ncbi:MAG: hypothetical protein AB1782_20770 [Cyanobacteriota bacterium]
MTFEDKRVIDPELKQDLTGIIKTVEDFAYERDSVLLSLLRQKRLPELFENCNN